MKLRTLFMLAIATFLLRVTTASAQQAYFKGLGPQPQGILQFATTVSDDGRVVGGRGGTGVWRWTEETGIVPLGFGGAPTDLSGDGSVMVGFTVPDDSSQAFRWTAAGGLQLFGPGIARGVSRDGSIVALQLQTNQGANYRAYRWDAINGAVELGKLPTDFPGLNNAAADVSANGEVIVGSQSDTSRRAFRWTQATGMFEMGPVPTGYSGTSAVATSADGSIAVGSLSLPGLPTDPPRSDAGRWTEATGWVSLGRLEGEHASVQSVSGDGSIAVGVVSFPEAEPFIWDAAHGMRNLTTVLRDEYGLGASLVGWNLGTAWDISADGRTIVGHGTGPLGQTQPWIAFLGTPVPEPSTWALAASGLVVAAFWIRRRLC